MEIDLRIRKIGVRGATIEFRFDERSVPAYEGESVAAALWAAGIRTLSTVQTWGPPPRALFCAMGACQQCAVWIDDKRVEACRTPVRAGLEVRSRQAS